MPGTSDISQPENGYRFSLDPFLLAAFADLPPERARRVADLGAGNGILSALLAKKYPSARLTGFDIRLSPLHHARMNLPAGHFVNADLRDVSRLVRGGAFDVAMSNPPYRKMGEGRLNPCPEKAVARHEVALTLAELAAAARHLLVERGIFFVVHLAERSAELHHVLLSGGFAPLSVRYVHSREGEPAFLVLASAVKGGKNSVTVLPPLYVHGASGGYSAEMEAIYGRFDAPLKR